MQDLSNENIIHVKKDNIEYIQFRKLLEYPELVHCYTLSAYGFDIVGNDTYKQKRDILYSNFEKLAKALEIQANTIIRPYQTHTNIVETIDNNWYENHEKKISIFPKELTNVDGLITNITDITFSLGFADCTPLYLYDPVKKVIGDIHSGWKGTLQRIGEIAVKKMIDKYYCNPKDIICCIGPCIKKCHFEVEEDVAKLFKDEFCDMDIKEIITKTSENKYVIDTTKINENMMKQMGLKEENIIDSGICTVCKEQYMHSYRVRKEEAGRNTAILGIRGEIACVIQKV